MHSILIHSNSSGAVSSTSSSSSSILCVCKFWLNSTVSHEYYKNNVVNIDYEMYVCSSIHLNHLRPHISTLFRVRRTSSDNKKERGNKNSGDWVFVLSPPQNNVDMSLSNLSKSTPSRLGHAFANAYLTTIHSPLKIYHNSPSVFDEDCVR